MGEGLSRHQRLRRRPDYLRCYRRGRKKYGSVAAIHYHANDLDEARLGITASRKVGCSVKRHLLKRWVREIFRRFEGRSDLSSLDIVVHLKPAAAHVDFAVFSTDLERLLRFLSSQRKRQ